jgi:hypothetical protein
LLNLKTDFILAVLSESSEKYVPITLQAIGCNFSASFGLLFHHKKL